MTEHVVTARIVYTAEDDGLPIGVLTGYVNEAGGFVLEHVVPFRPLAMRHLVRGGLDYAWRQGWPFVLFHCPSRHPLHRALVNIGKLLGFKEYAPAFWVAYKP